MCLSCRPGWWEGEARARRVRTESPVRTEPPGRFSTALSVQTESPVRTELPGRFSTSVLSSILFQISIEYEYLAGKIQLSTSILLEYLRVFPSIWGGGGGG